MRGLFVFRNYLSSSMWTVSLRMFSLSSLMTKDMILAPVAKRRLLGKENSFIFIWSSLQIFLNRSICILLMFQRKYFQLLSFIAGLRRHGSAKLFYISCYLGFHSSEYKVLSIAHAVVVQENEIAKATRLSWLDIEAQRVKRQALMVSLLLQALPGYSVRQRYTTDFYLRISK